jgi:para-aminobenzoate synthetase component 1
VDVVALAEAFRDLPGLVVLESARLGRRGRWHYLSADPLEVVAAADPAPHPLGRARRLLARVAADRPSLGEARGRRVARVGALAPSQETLASILPPFVGGLVGYVGYEIRRWLAAFPAPPPDDQGLPVLHLALHDWVVAVDGRDGTVWLGGRAVDGDLDRLARRLEGVLARLAGCSSGPGRPRDLAAPGLGTALAAGISPPTAFVSGLHRHAYRQAVEEIREAIAAGAIYQANLTRRLEAPFQGDPWPLYRALRRGDPAPFAAYLDLGRQPGRPGGRAIVSASPEPFLAVDAFGWVASDPIKGTRPRGASRWEDRALARQLLTSDKDRAENVMIVDVLRNDLGRLCQAGTVSVPRLCRLERTTAVQHLVSTVRGRLAAGRTVFDLLEAALPGASITGAPKLRAMEILDGLEPVARGPYSGCLGWIGPDGAMATSILIRTVVADGCRLTFHVGGGITWRSDPDAEWEETEAKARGPLAALGAREMPEEAAVGWRGLH